MSAAKEQNIFLGVELGGSRSSRTSLVALRLFSQEKKIFLTEIHSGLQGVIGENADDHLISLLNANSEAPIGINAPLTLPPCVGCELKCPRVENCVVPAVEWMREQAATSKTSKNKLVAPYAQRPIDILLRTKWLQEISVEIPLDETLGSGRAPLAARMQYLKRHLLSKKLLEVHPRFALAKIAPWFKISERELRRLRDVEEGLEIRIGILEKISGKPYSARVPSLFLYRADLLQLAQDISAFDALFCALMPAYEQLDLLESPELDIAWGNLAKPRKISVAPSELMPDQGGI